MNPSLAFLAAISVADRHFLLLFIARMFADFCSCNLSEFREIRDFLLQQLRTHLLLAFALLQVLVIRSHPLALQFGVGEI